MADARRGLFNTVVVWRFDRFARSVKQLVLALEEFQTLGIDFVPHQESLDSSTPMGKVMFTVIAAMAELERSLIPGKSSRWVELRPQEWHEVWEPGWTAQEDFQTRHRVRAS
jgi:DNA invertase Pin-like site-specific DNA recombinase